MAVLREFGRAGGLTGVARDRAQCLMQTDLPTVTAKRRGWLDYHRPLSLGAALRASEKRSRPSVWAPYSGCGVRASIRTICRFTFLIKTARFGRNLLSKIY